MTRSSSNPENGSKKLSDSEAEDEGLSFKDAEENPSVQTFKGFRDEVGDEDGSDSDDDEGPSKRKPTGHKVVQSDEDEDQEDELADSDDSKVTPPTNKSERDASTSKGSVKSQRENRK